MSCLGLLFTLLLRRRERLRSIVMSKFVCVSVCLSDRISPEPHARSLPIFVHVAYVRGTVLLRHVDDRPHRLSPGRSDGSAQRGQSVIYDYLVIVVITFCVSRRRRKMYCGQARLCVCLSVCPRPYAHITARTQM